MSGQECVAVLQDHIADLRRTADVIDKECGEAFAKTAAEIRKAADELEPLTAAIAAIKGQGEPVAYRWSRNGEPQGCWIDGKPSERQFQAAKDCAEMATWTVEYAYALPPQPPTGEQTP